jgi:tetratricopeptide (TPR) repeat protein
MDKNKVIESASKLIAKGALDKAIKEYQRVLDVDPDDVRILQKLAELYQKMQRRDEAADCFEKVARTYSAQGFYLKAVALYKQVLKVVDRIEVNVRLAELYQQLGLVGDATKEWQNVASHYEKVGDQKASLDTLKKLVDLDPDNVAARIRLGEQYARQEQTAEAVTELRRAATYLQRAGRQDDYLRVAERISHLDQGDATLARELAESYLARSDSKRALAKLQICFKANPRDLPTLQMLARAFQDLGQTSKTISVLKEQARVHADANRPGEARKVYEQALVLSPDDAELKASLRALESGAHSAPPQPSAPAPARPPTGPVSAPSRPPTGPLRPPTGPLRPPTGPVAGARPPTGPVVPPQTDPTPVAPGSVPKLLKETEVYVKYGLHDKALEHLRRIFSVEPENTEAHEKAKVLALAMNRPSEAVASLAVLVKLYVARSDPRAEAARTELRGLDANHPALRSGGIKATAKAARAPAPVDEEEISAETLELLDEPLETASAPAPRSAPAPAPARGSARRPVPPPAVELELDEEPIELADDVVNPTSAVDEAVVEDPEVVFSGGDPVSARRAAGAQKGSGQDVASDLAEADFYIQAGLTDDARAILKSILLAAPGHPEASRRIAALDGPAAGRKPARKAPPERSATDDLAAELAAELAEEVASLGPQEDDGPLEPESLDSFQVPVHEVLGEFRAKISETIRPEDVQTHYDLGIAYKEMALIDEAVAEFDLALRHSNGVRKADCLTMLGTCALEKGNVQDAIEWFKSGLSEPELTAEAKRALAFELASAYESVGQMGLALEQYQDVERVEPGFRDVEARIVRLGGEISGPNNVAPPRSGPPKRASTVPAPAGAAARAPANGLPSAPPQPSGSTGGGSPARPNRKIGFV